MAVENAREYHTGHTDSCLKGETAEGRVLELHIP